MKPTNFEDMSVEELNKAVAETFGNVELDAVGNRVVVFKDDCFDLDADQTFDLWNPCGPDSNQCERHLFPKLREDEDVDIGTLLMGPWFCVEIKKRHYIAERILKRDFDDMLFETETKVHDEINKTKVIACLKAFEKLKEGVRSE